MHFIKFIWHTKWTFMKYKPKLFQNLIKIVILRIVFAIFQMLIVNCDCIKEDLTFSTQICTIPCNKWRRIGTKNRQLATLMNFEQQQRKNGMNVWRIHHKNSYLKVFWMMLLCTSIGKMEKSRLGINALMEQLKLLHTFKSNTYGIIFVLNRHTYFDHYHCLRSIHVPWSLSYNLI